MPGLFGDVPADPATFREPGDVWLSMGDIEHHYMTCRNHPTARYLTKNPWTRSLHFITAPAEAGEPGWDGTGPGNLECRCPFGDLVVIDVDEAS